MDILHHILQFFKSIWHFAKRTWRILEHLKLFGNPHNFIIVVGFVVFIVLSCICSCWAQYLDEQDWRKHPTVEDEEEEEKEKEHQSPSWSESMVLFVQDSTPKFVE